MNFMGKMERPHASKWEKTGATSGFQGVFDVKKFSLLSVGGLKQTRIVTAVSRGKQKADLALVNGSVLNVYTGEMLTNWSLTVKGEWIAYVGEHPEDNIGKDTEVIDLKGHLVVPGLIDGHSHVADCLYNPIEFLSYAMAGGATTIITETIEPFPVRGYEGIVDFMDALQDQPIKVFYTAPAMASTSLMVHGIPTDILKKLLAREDVIGLGESYWQAVLQRPESFLPNFLETLLSGKHLEGHSAGAKGRLLTAYICPGISSCHEPISAEETLERLRLGLYVMVREGSIRRDLAAISKIKDAGVDMGRLILVSDGISPGDLLECGYMEHIVQKAIDCGFDPVTAIQMATINVAEYFHLDGFIGGLAPGRQADLLVIPDLKHIRPQIVFSRGKIVARDGNPLVAARKHGFSPESLQSVQLEKKVEPSNFRIPVEQNPAKAKVRVIDQVSDLVTRKLEIRVPVVNREIRAEPDRDLLKVAAVDRRFSPGKTFVGLIRGFGLKSGALACSSAWDTSDIIVVGGREEDMADAVNRISELQGGAVLCSGGRILEEIPLPILGLMSDLPMRELAERIDRFSSLAKSLGFPFRDPIRTLVTLTGAAIPFLRICEQGLIDIKKGKTLPLIIDEG